MTRRTISSPLTPIFKVVFPLAVIGAFVYSAVWLGALIFVCWVCVPLKHVAVDQTYVHVSNYVREIRVPLSEIVDITQNKLLNIRPVRITFYVETPFGNRVVFMPMPRLSTFSAHPIVAELRALVASAREHQRGSTDTEGRQSPAAPGEPSH